MIINLTIKSRFGSLLADFCFDYNRTQGKFNKS